MTHGSVLVNFAESPHFLHYPRPFTGTSFRNTKAQFRWNHHPFVINSNCICNKATNVSIVVVQFTIITTVYSKAINSSLSVKLLIDFSPIYLPEISGTIDLLMSAAALSITDMFNVYYVYCCKHDYTDNA